MPCSGGWRRSAPTAVGRKSPATPGGPYLATRTIADGEPAPHPTAHPTHKHDQPAPRAPATAAQEVADQLVAAGVASILNFAPAVISVPEGVSVRKVDLATELQILSFYQSHRRIKERAS